jgi:hypothetical protein
MCSHLIYPFTITIIGRTFQARLAELTPKVPDLTGYTPVMPNVVLEMSGVTVEFDSTGAIIQMTDTVSGASWASHQNPLAKFVYQVCM